MPQRHSPLEGVIRDAYFSSHHQRFISLEFRTTSTGLSATAPASGNLAPPGHYLLFLVNDDGVPSVGRVIRIR